jgi:heat shock protein beta
MENGNLLRRKSIAPLLRFTSSKSGEGLMGLQEYVDRAKSGQKSIYYIAADSLAAAANAPFVEQLVKKDLEVGGGCFDCC